MSKQQTADSKTSRRVGVLGGTFDPIHLAHIELATQAIEQCQLTELVFVPCSQPPHREQAQASNQQRYEMLMLAVEDLAHVSICDYELTKSSLSYTVETLEFLAESYPGRQLVFCLGGDSLNDFTFWHRWQDILNIAHLAVMRRSEDASKNCNQQRQGKKDVLADRKIESVGQMNKNAGQIIQITAPDLQISATLIRERIKHCANVTSNAGEQLSRDSLLSRWLAPKVLEYIIDNKVYQ